MPLTKVRAKDLNGAPQGVLIAGMELATLLSTISSDVSELLLNQNVVVTTDTTIPSTLTVTVIKGSVISITENKTLTVNGSISAGAYQIFSDANTVAVGFPNVSTRKGVVFNVGANQPFVYPQWWGANGDYVLSTGYTNTSATDNTQPFRKAILATAKQYDVNGNASILQRETTAEIQVPAGNYKFTAVINMYFGTKISGAGWDATSFHGAHSSYAVLSFESAIYAELYDVCIVGGDDQGFATNHPTGATVTKLVWNDINPSASNLAYFSGAIDLSSGGATSGMQTGIYAGQLIYEAST